jgi:hypothetical protein
MRNNFVLAGLLRRGLVRSVQLGTIQVVSANSADNTINPVNIDNSILLHLGRTSNSSSAWNTGSAFTRLSFTDNVTVTATRISTDIVEVTTSWMVLEFHPGVIKRIQRGVIVTAGASSGTAAIEAVDTKKTVLFDVGYAISNGTGSHEPAPHYWKLVITNPTLLTASAQASPTAVHYGYQAVEFN